MSENLATQNQLAYIEKLAKECKATIFTPLGELTTDDASRIIEELVGKVNAMRQNKTATRDFGMRESLAFQVCYHNWQQRGSDIFFHRERFVDDVLDTLGLLNEISRKAKNAGPENRSCEVI